VITTESKVTIHSENESQLVSKSGEIRIIARNSRNLQIIEFKSMDECEGFGSTFDS